MEIINDLYSGASSARLEADCQALVALLKLIEERPV